MYSRYAERQGWRVEVLNMSDSGAGGIKEVIAIIEGRGVYSRLKYESGVHRVQRVPATEASGRIHTSTATVAVLPEAEEVDIQIDAKDLRIDTFCSSGPGGQSVNTTYSAVRITHIPTDTGGVAAGREIADQEPREGHESPAVAALRDGDAEAAGSDRQGSPDARSGTGDRSEKIRTYNFRENRITDHRIGFTMHQLTAGTRWRYRRSHRRRRRTLHVREAQGSHRQRRRFRPGHTCTDAVAPREPRGRPADAHRRPAFRKEEAALDAEVLARHVLGCDRATLLTRARDPLPSAFDRLYRALIARRVAREPVAYIVGHREFWGLEFDVSQSVLIPRPETELIIEEALASLPRRDSVRHIIDVGTGSGCLAVTLAVEFPPAQVTATDTSHERSGSRLPKRHSPQRRRANRFRPGAICWRVSQGRPI